MTDPFDITAPRQRYAVLGTLALYIVLYVVQFATGNPAVGAIADLLLALLVIPASVLIVRRATLGTNDTLAIATGLAFLVASVSIGYEGLSTLELVPKITAVQTVGTVALLLALVLYLYRNR